jgi:hypothetical protein
MTGKKILIASVAALAVAAVLGIAYHAGSTLRGNARESVRDVVDSRLKALDGIEARLARLEEAVAAFGAAPPAVAPAPGTEAEAAEANGGWAAVTASLSTLERRVKGLEEDPVRRGFSYLSSENAEMRREGINILERVARFDPEARAAIRHLLHDPSPRVREQAAQILRNLGDKESAPEMKALLADQDARTRRRAIQALGAAEARDAARDIGRSLVSDADDQVREAAAGALRQLKSQEAEDFLIEALKDRNIAVRAEAIAGLGEIGATAAAPTLRAMYEQDPGANRLRLVLALKSLGDGAPLEREVGRLSDLALSGADERVRGQAIRELAVLARDASQNIFTQALADPSPAVRREAERALR